MVNAFHKLKLVTRRLIIKEGRAEASKEHELDQVNIPKSVKLKIFIVKFTDAKVQLNPAITDPPVTEIVYKNKKHVFSTEQVHI